MTKKVDYTMEILHKIISVLTVLACVAGLAWSCTNDADITACADIAVPDWAVPLQSYTDSYEQSLNEIQNQNGYLAHVLNDPNVSDEEKRQILIGNALQTFDFKFAADLLAHWNDDGFPTEPEVVNVTGSGAYGLFKTTSDSTIHFGTWFLNSQSLFQSDVINLAIDTTNSGYDVSSMRFRSYVTATNVLVFNILSPAGVYSNFTIYDTSGYMGRTRATTGTDWYVASLNVNNAVPIVPPGSSLDVYSAYGAMTKGSPLLSLPSGTMDTSTPWDYYNDTLLPYLRSNVYNSLSSNIDVTQLLVFPNGYIPGQDPTEPGLPNGGITVNNNWNFNIGIISVPVTDASGQPVTDASGETVTETAIETETRPTDAVYHFQIPTLTPLDTQVATIPPYEVPSEYAGYMSDMFSAITDFIDDAGLSSIAPVFLTLAGIGLVIGVLL